MASYLMARNFAYDPKRFQWLTRLHVVAIACLVLVAFLVQRASSVHYITTLIMVIGALMLLASMLINAVPPMVTKHAVTGSEVILRQGAFFELKIPFANIGKVRQTEDIPYRPGIKAARMESALYVLATTKGAVRFELREPLHYKGIALEFVVADFDKPEEFLACLEERMEGERILAKHDGKKKKKKGSKTPAAYPRDPLLPPPRFKKAVIDKPDIPDDIMESSDEEGEEDEGDEEQELGTTEDEEEPAGEHDEDLPSLKKKVVVERTVATKVEDQEPPEDDDVTPERIPPPKPKKASQKEPAPAPEKEIEEYVAVPAWSSGASAEERPRIVRIPKRKLK